MKYTLWAGMILAVLLFASCATTSFAGGEGRIIPEDFIGISPDRTGLVPLYMERLDELGAVWIRAAADWADIEREEGQWDFSRWDEYIDRAETGGKKLLVILCYDVPWLYEDHQEHRDLTDREIPYFLNYIETFLTRYRGRLGAVEIWNEPNAPAGLVPGVGFWKGSDEHFYALSIAAAKKVKEIDPSLPVLAGALFRVWPGFVRGMFRAGAFDYVDAISLHPYSSDALHTVRQIDKLRLLMAEFNCFKPIWVTEVGYPTEGFWFSPSSLRTYPEYITKTLAGLAVRGVERVIWYELMDEYTPPEVPDHWNPGHFFGLIYPNGDLKNGAEAFKLCSRFLPGSVYRPDLPHRDRVSQWVTSLCFIREDENTLLLWYYGMEPETLFLDLSGAERIRCHDIATGRAVPLDPLSLLSLTNEPVFITWTGEAVPSLSGRIPKALK
jgi:hypothetical protein